MLIPIKKNFQLDMGHLDKDILKYPIFKMLEEIPYYLRNAGLRHHSKPKYVEYNLIARIKKTQ